MVPCAVCRTLLFVINKLLSFEADSSPYPFSSKEDAVKENYLSVLETSTLI